MKNLQIFLLLLPFLFISTSLTAQDEYEDKVESPYFLVKGAAEGVELPLVASNAKVDIAGVIANVEIEQVYVNSGDSTIEAEYVFPGSTKSAVHGMTMWIGERKIEAKIKEKEQAKKDFEKAQKEGKTASLLQQHRPNVFQMNVANIIPGDTIKVTLRYNEILSHEEGIYEFVYPTIVGPRYASKEGVEKDSWVLNPFANPEVAKQTGAENKANFGISVNLNASIPVKEAFSPSHDVDIAYSSPKAATINLKRTESLKGNKDFIIKYRLSGDQIESGFSVFEAGDEKFFMLMVQPPKRVISTEIPAREYVFIVDVSGSMHGYPIDISKKLMRNLLSNLRPKDKFNVMLFSAGSSVLSNTSLSATPENIEEGIGFIDKESGSGGTELLPALENALNLPGNEDVSRSIVIVTDGYVTVEKEAFDLIRDNAGNANFFAFGIGNSVNRYLIEGMARVGNGEPLIITKSNEAEAQAERFRKYIQNPVLAKVELQLKGMDVYDVEPKKVSDLFAEKPIVVLGKYRGEANGEVVLSGITGKGNFSKNIAVKAKSEEKNSPLRHLWARQKITRLSDYNRLSHEEETKEAITDLGLRYSLLTDYTSFIGVDSEVRTQAEVSSVSATPGAVPEPHEWALIILSAMVFIYFLFPYFKAKLVQK